MSKADEFVKGMLLIHPQGPSKQPFGGSTYYQIQEIKKSVLTVLAYDVYRAETEEWPIKKARECSKWRRVGIYDFAPWDDEACGNIRFAHQNPQGAGRMITDLKKKVADFDILLALARRQHEMLKIFFGTGKRFKGVEALIREGGKLLEVPE